MGLSVVEVAELLHEAVVASGRPAQPGSVVQRLLDSDSPGSFAYAREVTFEADEDAPVLPPHIGTAKIGEREIPRFGLGCMRLVSAGGVVKGEPVSAWGLPRSPEANRHALLNAALVSGVRYFDASRGYGAWPGAGERLLWEWLSPVSDRVLVASKVGYRRERSGAWSVDLDPAFIRREVDASIASFGGRVPVLYLVTRSTPTTPVVNRPDEILRSLEPLLEAQAVGQIGCLGLANTNAEDLEHLSRYASIGVVQNRFGLAMLREPSERAVFDACRERGLPFVAWGLFGEGAKPAPAPLPVIVKHATELEVSAEELTIAVLLAAAPHVVPLPGPGRRRTLESCLEGAALEIEPERLAVVLRELGA